MLKKVLLHIVFVLLLGGVSKASSSTDVNYGDDGGKDKNKNKSSLFNSKSDHLNQQSLSLKSGIAFRGDNIFSKTENQQTINLKTFVTYKSGNNTITLPYKKLVIVGKITLNSELRR